MKEILIGIVVIVVAWTVGSILADKVLSRKPRDEGDRDRWRGPDFLR